MLIVSFWGREQRLDGEVALEEGRACGMPGEALRTRLRAFVLILPIWSRGQRFDCEFALNEAAAWMGAFTTSTASKIFLQGKLYRIHALRTLA